MPHGNTFAAVIMLWKHCLLLDLEQRFTLHFNDYRIEGKFANLINFP